MKKLLPFLCSLAIVALGYWIFADSIQAYLRGASARITQSFGTFEEVRATFAGEKESNHAYLQSKYVTSTRPAPTTIGYYTFRIANGKSFTVMLEHASYSSAATFVSALEDQPDQTLLIGSFGERFGYFAHWPASEIPYTVKDGFIQKDPNASWLWAFWCVGVLGGLCITAVAILAMGAIWNIKEIEPTDQP